MAYGLLVCLASPPVDLWPLAVVVPVPLVWVACRMAANPRRLWRGALLTCLGVLPAWLFEERWLIDVTTPGYPLMAVYMSLYAGAFVALMAAIGRAAPRLPWSVVVGVLWVGMEVLRGEVVMTGYPWFLVAHPLIAWPVLAAPAGVLGAYFVSFLVACLAGAATDAIGWGGRAARRPVAALAAGMVAAAWVSTGWVGWTVGGGGPTTAVRVGVVQTNLPQDNKMDWPIEDRLRGFQRFEDLTRQVANTDLIIWPETMFPGNELNPDAVEVERRAALMWRIEKGGAPDVPGDAVPTTVFADALVQLQKDLGVPMLVGSPAIEGLRVIPAGAGGQVRTESRARFNSVFLVMDGRVRPDRYDKLALTPFGEVIPLVWRWPRVQEWIVSLGAAGMSFDLSPGREATVFQVPVGSRGGGSVRLVTPICFEATKARVCRQLAYSAGRRRADLLVNLSNDGWFGGAAGGREQHLLAARWRCAELGMPMVRSVNTGISAAIDRHGRMLAAGPDGLDQDVNVDGVMTATVDVPTGEGGTVYGQVGDAFAWMMLGATVLGPLWAAWSFRRKRANTGG